MRRHANGMCDATSVGRIEGGHHTRTLFITIQQPSVRRLPLFSSRLPFLDCGYALYIKPKYFMLLQAYSSYQLLSFQLGRAITFLGKSGFVPGWNPESFPAGPAQVPVRQVQVRYRNSNRPSFNPRGLKNLGPFFPQGRLLGDTIRTGLFFHTRGIYRGTPPGLLNRGEIVPLYANPGVKVYKYVALKRNLSREAIKERR